MLRNMELVGHGAAAGAVPGVRPGDFDCFHDSAQRGVSGKSICYPSAWWCE